MTTEKVNATVNGVTAFLFSCTGPVAIIITVAEATGLSDRHIASWLFGGFAITGLYTLYYSLHYRQPLTFAWTIPGTVLLLSALDHLQFEQVVSAFLVTALVIALIGLSGWMQRIMAWVPHSIVMAMVAGIFVEFGLKLIDAFSDSALIASSMVVGYVCCALSVRLQRFVPPILAALLIGAVMVMLTGSFKATSAPMAFITVPVIFVPQFSLQAIIELVIPLSITVLMVQNGQGFAVLGHAGHKPPTNSMTTACGTGSLLLGLVGSVSMCVTGPANAILASSGAKEVQYVGGITYGVLAITFGLFSSFMVWLALKLPLSYIAVLGGLAVFKVLEGAFVSAFTGRHTMAALTTFLVTVSGISLWNIGSPFWGLAFGLGISVLFDRRSER